ncbi:MAG: 1-acyl-sn-glycerol-3-phosphate acyltransferase [Verrucomicrobia bacterium]|jgi:1-acyl-sn-glycerol-3-phosphate acyltransferase|nr:1-acyl-sn-glycerol-3-phosphate acyltransferase [Verrucomicrobiota bacterium]
MIPRPTDPPYCDYENLSPKAAPLSRLFPSFGFYQRMTRIVLASAVMAKRGRFGDEEWYTASLKAREIFENCGCPVKIEGTRHLAGLEGPAVIIGNHMSTAETFLMAGFVLPFTPLTFVVKRSLVEYPVFKHIMISRDPVVVGRENPREDLRAVMDGGRQRLGRGVTITVFPQRTRKVTFDRSQFNTIGGKLARKAGVPVVPLALKTNAWSNGKWLKDYGPFLPSESMRFSFGEPLDSGIGDKVLHEKVVAFIEAHLREWGVPIAG